MIGILEWKGRILREICGNVVVTVMHFLKSFKGLKFKRSLYFFNHTLCLCISVFAIHLLYAAAFVYDLLPTRAQAP